MNDCLSLGETMVLFTATTHEKLTLATQFHKSLGGAESNFAIALARLGYRSAWWSRLGADPLGKFIFHTIKANGVDVSHVSLVPNERTGIYFKTLHSTTTAQHPTLFYDRRASAFSTSTPAMLKKSFLSKHRLFHTTGITACLSASAYHTVLAAITHFTKQKASQQKHITLPRIIFDLNIRPKLWHPPTSQQRLLTLARKSDIVLGSRAEFNKLFAPFQARSAHQVATYALHQCKFRAIIVKLAAKGSHYFAPTENVYAQAFPVPKIVDPIGAGDAFAAGFIAARLAGKSIAAALTQGNAMGAIVLSAPGDIEPLPTLDQLHAFMQTHSPHPS